jgi:UDP-N-acetylmuramyl pentapeptide phosphotransferase/UDP-N-acetylglucosamine-1-phosphate transferase
MLVTIGLGILGFIDDYLHVVRHRKGLPAAKTSRQILINAAVE